MSYADWAAWLEALGTILVAVLAIWGDYLKAKLVGPKLELTLHDPQGDLAIRNDGTRARYYHLKVSNKRAWSPAKKVRTLVTGLEKMNPDKTFSSEQLVIPLQLHWAYGFSGYSELLPTIGHSPRFCDLGFLDENREAFAITTYENPSNFKGRVRPGETLRVRLAALADNFVGEHVLVLQISWDGHWSADATEMQQHLIIQQVKP